MSGQIREGGGRGPVRFIAAPMLSSSHSLGHNKDWLEDITLKTNHSIWGVS